MAFLPYQDLVVKDKLEAVDIILAFGCCTSYCDCAMRLFNMKLQRGKLATTLHIIKKKFWVVDNEYSSEEIIKHEQITKQLIFSTKMYGFMIICLWFFYWYLGFITKREFSEEAMPIPSYKELLGVPWYVMFFYMMLTDVFLVSVLFISDTLMRTFLSLARLQISLINYKIKNIFEASDNTMIKEDLRKCARHLNLLFAFRDLVNDIFSKILLYYMAMIMATICMQMFVATFSNSKDARMGAFEIASLYAVQMIFIYCHPAQEMENETEDLPNSLYSGKWTKYPMFHKDVVLLIGKSQQRIFLSAGGLIDLNYATGIAAFKSMFSYYAFLRTVSSPTD